MKPSLELKAIRKRLGLTQQQLADKIGITKSQVWRIENNLSGTTEPVLRMARGLDRRAKIFLDFV